ncbi:MAG: glycosyltransferase family 2 protein [Cyanobacteria bacterium P01_H01_bin.15]
MHSPTFSIVITTYNRQNLLKRAIQSAMAQTLDCEIIVVDDGSVDVNEKYVHSLNSRIIFEKHDHNKGHSAAVNQGVELATGEWIKLLDDDDYLMPNCLEVFANAITIYPNTVICSAKAVNIAEDGHPLKTPLNETGGLEWIAQEDIHYRMLIEQLAFGTPTQVMFKREAFQKSGYWNAFFDGNYDDVSSWVDIAQQGNAILIDRAIGYRTLWSGCFHKQLNLYERWKMNVTIKEKIYPLVSSKYKNSRVELTTINNYLRIYWFLVGVKQNMFLPAIQLLSWGCLWPSAWLMLWRTFQYRQNSSYK